MLLAELEVFHNRPFSPTRRLALGRRDLPADPPPGFGPLLLGAVAAVCGEELDADDRSALRRLLSHLELGHRIPGLAPGAPGLGHGPAVEPAIGVQQRAMGAGVQQADRLMLAMHLQQQAR